MHTANRLLVYIHCPFDASFGYTFPTRPNIMLTDFAIIPAKFAHSIEVSFRRI